MRLRNIWFLDLFTIGCRLERLWVSQDGQRKWRTDSWPYELDNREIGYSEPSEAAQ